MHTYLRMDELIQEGRELQWTAVAFEEREMPPDTQSLYGAWLRHARRAAAGRAAPPSGWDAMPATGRDLARHAGEVLALLSRMHGQG